MRLRLAKGTGCVIRATIGTLTIVVALATATTSAAAPPASPSDTPPATPAATPVSVSPTVSPTPTPSVTPTPTPTSSTQPPRARAAVVLLTLDAPSPQSQWEDRPVRLSGRLSNNASWSVSLWRLISTGWTRIGYVRANQGDFAVTVRPPSASTWTVKAVLGAKPTDPVQSGLRKIWVKNRTIALNRPASAYTALSGVTLAGRVTPAEAGRRVMLEYRYGSGWRGLKLVTADASGVFRVRVPDNFPKRWTVRARTFESPSSAIEYTPAYTFDVKAYLWPRVFTVTAADIPRTYRSGCPVAPSQLRRLTLTHWGFDGRLHRGELILRSGAVQTQIAVWNAAIMNRFLVRGMHRVDIYGGSDIRSMEADNTSAFNCRTVTGNPYALSPHSYGYAIDINTVENPYKAVNGVWYPKNGLSYRNRSVVRPGMLFTGSTPTRALVGRGYQWGATWRNPDYQHFAPR
jgi:D-alanyl-D-alanine carboxypeptidase-like protein